MKKLKLILVLFIIGCFIESGYSRQIEKNRIKPKNKHIYLFLAKKIDEHKVEIIIYSPEKNKIIFKQNFVQDDFVEYTASTSTGSNHAYQYNYITKEVYFITRGGSENDGKCQNKDGTCYCPEYIKLIYFQAKQINLKFMWEDG